METTIPHSTPAQAPGPSAWRETESTAYPNEEVRSKAGNSKVIVLLCYCWVTYKFSSLNLYNFIVLLSVCQELEHGLAGFSFQGISRLKVSAGDAISLGSGYTSGSLVVSIIKEPSLFSLSRPAGKSL